MKVTGATYVPLHHSWLWEEGRRAWHLPLSWLILTLSPAGRAWVAVYRRDQTDNITVHVRDATSLSFTIQLCHKKARVAV